MAGEGYFVRRLPEGGYVVRAAREDPFSFGRPLFASTSLRDAMMFIYVKMRRSEDVVDLQPSLQEELKS